VNPDSQQALDYLQTISPDSAAIFLRLVQAVSDIVQIGKTKRKDDCDPMSWSFRHHSRSRRDANFGTKMELMGGIICALAQRVEVVGPT
jgi:hypothetical protein